MTLLNPPLGSLQTVTTLGASDLVLVMASGGTFKWISGQDLITNLGQAATGLPVIGSLSGGMMIVVNDGTADSRVSLSTLSTFFGATATVPSLQVLGVATSAVAGQSTISGSFSNGAPTSLSAMLDGSAVSLSQVSIQTQTGTGATAQGSFSANIITPTVGSHTLVIIGAGGNTATSPVFSFTISAASAASLSIANIGASFTGSTITVNGSYTGATPSGFTYAFDGGAPVAAPNPSISASTWSFSIVVPSAGTHTVTVTGAGANTATVTSNAFTATAASGGFTVTSVSPATLGVAGQPVTFNVAVSGGALTSTGLTVLVDGTVVAPSAVTANALTITAPATTTGNPHTGLHTISLQGPTGSAASAAFALQAAASVPFTLNMSPTYGTGLFSVTAPLSAGIVANCQFVFTPTAVTADGTIYQPSTDVPFGPTVPTPAPASVSFVWGTSPATPPTIGNGGGSMTAWGIGYATDVPVATYGGGLYVRIGAPLGAASAAKPPSGSYYPWIFVKMTDGSFYSFVGTALLSP